MDESGNTKDDLQLPRGTDELEKLAEQIRSDFDAGKDISVTVLKVGWGRCCAEKRTLLTWLDINNMACSTRIMNITQAMNEEMICALKATNAA